MISPISEDDGSSTAVVIIGETTRGDHMGINGYSRNTTPLLVKKDIISYKNVVSIGSHTLLSTPFIFTRKPVEKEWIHKLFPEKSFISAFKEAGYKTYYISYLEQVHWGDNAINQIVNEADVYIRRDGEYDESGISNIKDILKDDSSKKLIVYKLIGSHFNFQDRYPDRYDKFTPSFKTVAYKGDDATKKDIFINTYDNSVLYTDYVVASIIDLLEGQTGEATLSFVSDHGISIYEDGVTYGQGATKATHNIPMFFWFNKNAERRLDNERVANLKNNTSKLVDQTYFIDTIFELNGIMTSKHVGRNLFDRIDDTDIKVIIGNEVVPYENLAK